jgi:hypothetical protein
MSHGTTALMREHDAEVVDIPRDTDSPCGEMKGMIRWLSDYRGDCKALSDSHAKKKLSTFFFLDVTKDAIIEGGVS